MTGNQPDFTGIVRHFSGTAIDGNGIPYLEFALTLTNDECSYTYPHDVVNYIDLTQDNAPSIVTLVIAACAFQFQIDVFLKGSIRQDMQVADVQKTLGLEN
ncbi:MAG: hypothetical protein JO237_00415 [Pseudolabrys sp.]|nr:hypothetical protein [Pseudolabrys sp.]